jgi:hypothetical protein
VARPAVAVGNVRLHILGPDTTTSRGHVSGVGASGNHSKAIDGSGLQFTGDALEDDLAGDTDLLEDAFAVVELNTGTLASPIWTEIGTPYMLSPGSGTVVGSDGKRSYTPVATSALHGLLDECVVLPTEVDTDSPTMRYACGIEQNRYLGWQSKGYQESLHPGTWNDADIFTPSSGGAKDGKPQGWEDSAAEWIFRDADEGGLTLFRIGTFTLADRTLVKFVSSADEEHKVYLDGPNMGGVIIDGGAQETGYTEINKWKRRLEPGTYRVAAEMTTVGSVGGDGNDSFRFSCYTVDTDNNMDTVLLRSDGDTRVHRQEKNDERPGMSIGEVIRRLLEDNDTLGVDAATLLLANATFLDSIDSATDAWPSGVEWVWPLGTSLASALADMSEDADIDMGPDFSFNVWGDRGSDLSATVALTPGAATPTAAMNILEYGYDSDPPGPNAYLTLSQDGYAAVTGTIGAGVRRRYGYLESGTSGSIARARANARAAIRQAKEPRRYYRGKIIAVAGHTPYTNFNLCDVISGRNHANAALDLEVTDIAWEQGDGTTLFTIELGEV